MSELLRHPLTILAVGALVTGIFVPALTSALQRRRTARELKIQLVTELTRAVAAYQAALEQLVTTRHLDDGAERHRARWDAANAAAGAWKVEAATLKAVLGAHLEREEPVRYLARLSEFLNESFAMIYFVVNPRGDRVHMDAAYDRLLALAGELEVDLGRLPAEAGEYVRLSESESPVGTMWKPLADAASAASSRLAAMVLATPVAWLERGALRRGRQAPR